jgi:hypothetical protein
MSNVEIKLTENCTVGSFVKVDGTVLKGVVDVKVDGTVNEIPKVYVALQGNTELSLVAEIYKTLIFSESELSDIGFRFRNITGNRDQLGNKTNSDIGSAIVEAITGNKVVIK